MSKKFLRIRELEKLNSFFNRKTFECVFIYGRRRMGKTYLINQFIQDKKDVFFFTCVKSDEINFEVFAQELAKLTGIPYTRNSFKNWDEALNALFHWAQQKEHPIIIFDEFPYVCDVNGNVESIFQKYIDKLFSTIKAYLILCGSHLHMMQELANNNSRPLFGRKTEEIKLEPLNYLDSCSMFEGVWPVMWENSEDRLKKQHIEQLKVYMTVGGIPYYLEKALKYKNYEEFINNEFLLGTGISSDLTTIISSEFDNSYIYNDIIKLISSGKNKFNEIQSLIRTNSNITSFLKKLENINYIDNIQPIAFTPSKKNIYVIKDTLFDFFYKIIYSAILGNISKTWYKDNQDKFDTYFGNKFEEVCKEFMLIHNHDWQIMFGFNVWKAGRWWGTDNKNKKQTDIDVLCINESKNQIILCDCKWTNEKYTNSLYNSFYEKTEIFHDIDKLKKHIVLFSMEGYNEVFVKTMKDNYLSKINIPVLISIDDLFIKKIEGK